MAKLKVMTIVGTRPEIIRLSRIMFEMDKHFEHIIVHTGQNYDYELNEIFFSDLEIRKPDVFLNAARDTAAETIGQVIIATDKIMREKSPDALLILGDTNSSLAAISAKRLKIPIFHMEAGNRCFDFRVPEEINRRIVDHISDINLPYSEIAREYLLRENFPADQIIKTGSPMREVIKYYWSSIESSDVLSKLQLTSGDYFLVSAHREENVDSSDNLSQLMALLDSLAMKYNLPIIFSTHPRTRLRLEELGIVPNPLIKFLKPFGFFDYINLQINAHCVLSDSGTITEESSILNFPALNLREEQERPEGFEEGTVMFVGLSIERVHQGLSILKDQLQSSSRQLQLVKDYEPVNVSLKILRIIQTYTDFVNNKVWKKR